MLAYLSNPNRLSAVANLDVIVAIIITGVGA